MFVSQHFIAVVYGLDEWLWHNTL